MHVLFYKDRKGEWRWRLRASNGKIVADSGEGYKRRGACIRAWTRMAAHVGTKPVEPRFPE